MRIIAIANEKGGVGKTTSTVNIADALNRLGKKVLLLDCDGQGSLTVSLGMDNPLPSKTIADFLLNPNSFKDVVLKREGGLDLIPEVDRSISRVNEQMSSRLSGHKVLKKALDNVSGYDFLLIDSTPTLGNVLVNILCAAQEVLIPLQAHTFSEFGLADIVRDINEVKDLNPKIDISGIFVTFYDKAKPAGDRVLSNAKATFNGKVMNTKIRYSTSIKEGNAVDFGMTLFEYGEKKLTRRLPVAEDYMELAREIIKRGEKK